MRIFRRKNRWQRLVEPVVAKAPPVGKSGLAAVGTVFALTAASAVVSSIRHRQDKS